MPGTGPRPRLNNKNMSLSPTSPPTLHPGRASPPTSPPPPPPHSTHPPPPLSTQGVLRRVMETAVMETVMETHHCLHLQTRRLAGALLLPLSLRPPPSTLPLSPNVCSNSLTHSLNNQVMSNSQLREEVRLWRKRGSGSRGSRRAPRPITRRMEASRVTREYGVVVCSVSCDE